MKTSNMADTDQTRSGDILVNTDWLADNLKNPDLRVFDCAAQPGPNPDETRRRKYPLSPSDARTLYEERHIPGAGYIDIPNDLTDQSSEIPMMLAPASQLVEAFANAGISNDCHVVLYSSTGAMWATRVWCALRSIGFTKASILDGGMGKWRAEQRPGSVEPANYPTGVLDARPRTGIFVGKEHVLDALNDKDTLLIHALTPSVFDGSNDQLIFGRRGHIPGSINIPSGTLHDPETGIYATVETLGDIFDRAGVREAKHILTYCGGGINASLNTFALALLGYDNVSIYDGSMNEWGNDETLPVERKG